ncbi:DUF421 domain-containing protein [Occultella glacieicola]|uniref:DUF421 domain-containing protein n=1 Tax=Occultella glacieicola TaxID=2518684 RepID=A0ABY2E2M0_9MICO|nr:YetF domain-containing protein [Occultella glacieicola]TDE93869.1 DUF421 domain-containing protein [Occultella glacieicola]
MDIVIRAAVIFVFLWFITRVVGRSTLGELSSFQLIVFITMGDLVQQAVTQQDYSVTAAVLAVGTFAILTIAISWVNARWRKAARVTHGVPVVVFADGEPAMPQMRRERLSLDDFMAAARGQGITSFAEIRLAVLESNGQLSFFTNEGATQGAPEEPEPG